MKTLERSFPTESQALDYVNELSIFDLRRALEDQGFSDRLQRSRRDKYGRNQWTYVRKGKRLLLAISDDDARKVLFGRMSISD